MRGGDSDYRNGADDHDERHVAKLDNAELP